MTRILLAAAALILFASPLTAQRPSCDRDRSADREQRHQATMEKRQELRTWFQDNVLPEVTAWQSEYDASLSSEHLSALKGLRTEASDLRHKIHLQMQELRTNSTTADKTSMRKQMNDLKRSHRAEMRDILQRLKPIAKTSKEALRDLYDANEDQIEEWREHVRDAVGDRDGGERHHGGRSHGLDELGMLMGRGKQMAIRFMLWDATRPTTLPAPSLPAATSVDERAMHSSSIQVAPNPASNNARVSVQGLTERTATIEIFDMNGTLVGSNVADVKNGQLNAVVSTDGLAPGTYMISVNTPSGRRSQTLVISK